MGVYTYTACIITVKLGAEMLRYFIQLHDKFEGED